MRSQPNMLLRFIRLNMSLHVHVFAVPNRHAPQVFCTCSNSSAVWVSAQSRDVFITACIANEKWLAAELIRMHISTWQQCLRAENLIRLFPCMHA